MKRLTFVRIAAFALLALAGAASTSAPVAAAVEQFTVIGVQNHRAWVTIYRSNYGLSRTIVESGWMKAGGAFRYAMDTDKHYFVRAEVMDSPTGDRRIFDTTVEVAPHNMSSCTLYTDGKGNFWFTTRVSRY